MPLDEYTKTCPPGWSPHQGNYPLRLYMERMNLWLIITDLDHRKVGPTVVGRLKLAAYRLAMKITAP